MSLTWYEPWTDLDRILDHALSVRFSPASRGGTSNTKAFHPKMNLYEEPEKNQVVATFELPGLAKQDVGISLQGGRLTIHGEMKSEEERTGKGYAVRERSYGSFSRTLQVPQGAKPEDIKASMENGVLTVTFPKTTEEQAAKKITVL